MPARHRGGRQTHLRHVLAHLLGINIAHATHSIIFPATAKLLTDILVALPPVSEEEPSLGLDNCGAELGRRRGVCDELLDRISACRLAEDGDLCRIAAEVINVILDPFQRESLVQET
ncbi:hypothetical protein BDW74DRAFT_155263 [Aspergillus multicolor]|uniref:uncharacterized protein n=1 Tax=Aspergillus multicolor TaxID=41759 RepID=UPI003CCDD178